MLYVWTATGVVMSRSSLLYGPFSLVWGTGSALLTLCLWPFRHRGPWVLLLAGAVLGAGFEYLASIAGQLLFHRIFWDYSYMPFHLNGRTNLLFALFWGLAAALWILRGFPFLSGWLDRIPPRAGRALLRAAFLLLSVDIFLSAAALLRMEERRTGLPAGTPMAQAMDLWYPDRLLHARYPNLMDPPTS